MRPKAYGRFFADAMFQKVKIGDNKQDSVTHPKKNIRIVRINANGSDKRKKQAFMQEGKLFQP